MELASVLADNKEKIIGEWFDMAVDIYPPDTAKFLKNKADRFANPVGYNFSAAMEAVLAYLISNDESDDVVGALEGLIKIKAVQDFTASQAVRFIFLLKKIVRKHAGKSYEDRPVSPLVLRPLHEEQGQDTRAQGIRAKEYALQAPRAG